MKPHRNNDEQFHEYQPMINFNPESIVQLIIKHVHLFDYISTNSFNVQVLPAFLRVYLDEIYLLINISAGIVFILFK